jgi:hypothetical protein
MKRKHYVPSMVQAITVLTVLKMLTNGKYSTAVTLNVIIYMRFDVFMALRRMMMFLGFGVV